MLHASKSENLLPKTLYSGALLKVHFSVDAKRQKHWYHMRKIILAHKGKEKSWLNFQICTIIHSTEIGVT